MNHEKDNNSIAVLVALLGIAVLLAGCVVELCRLRYVMQAQFDYQIEMQLCLQDATQTHAPCYLEVETTGEAHWYYNAAEGRM